MSAARQTLKRLIDKVRNRWNPNRSNPLFGQHAADQIREHGYTYLEPAFANEGGKLPVLAKKLLNSDNEYIRRIGEAMSKRFVAGMDVSRLDSGAPSLPKSRRYVLDMAHDSPRNRKNPFFDRFSKMREAAVFEGIGQTRLLNDVLKKRKGRTQISDVLNAEHPEGWVVKLNDGADSLGSRSKGNPVLFFSGDEDLSALNAMRHKLRKDYIVQPKKELAPVSVVSRFIDKHFFPGKVTGSLSGKQEYRVHTMNGRVVPYATVHRGSAFNILANLLRPFRSKQQRLAESYAQAQLDNTKFKKYRSGSYGMDVAFDSKNRPQLIETNPADRGGTSGFLQHPIVTDAVIGAAKGELPAFIKAKRLAYGTGALGLGGLGVKALNSDKEDANN